jgi:hypothetical protein
MMPLSKTRANFDHSPFPQDTTAAALQERTDAKWWLGKEGQATLNGTKNRDVETFWQQAAAAHVNVRGNLKQVSPCTVTSALRHAGTQPRGLQVDALHVAIQQTPLAVE